MKVRDSDLLAWIREQNRMSQVGTRRVWTAGFHHVTALCVGVSGSSAYGLDGPGIECSLDDITDDDIPDDK
jgi:hypothetical protein